MTLQANLTDLPDILSDLSRSKQPNEFILQVCFGIFGAIGTLVTLASLHYRDSLGCVLFRSRFTAPEHNCKFMGQRLS